MKPDQRLMSRKEPMLTKGRVPGRRAESRLLPGKTVRAFYSFFCDGDQHDDADVTAVTKQYHFVDYFYPTVCITLFFSIQMANV